MITSSKYELAAACSSAFALPWTHERTEASEAGTARHAARERDINAGNVPDALVERWPDLEWRAEVAFAYNVATGQGRELGVAIGRGYEAAGAESFEVCGTADVVGYGRGKLVILDWKSFDPNVSRAAQNAQLHVIALAAARAYGLLEAEVAIHHEVRGLDVAALDALDLDAFAADVAQLVADVAKVRAAHRAGLPLTFSPGQHCRYCPAFHACPQQQQLALEVSSGAADHRVELLSLDDDETAADAYEFSKRIGMLKKRLDERLYARAKDRPIPLRGGKVFGLRETLGNREIDGDAAWKYIAEAHGRDVADDAVTREASQKSIEAALKRHGVPTPAKAKDAVLRELEARGGVTRKRKSAVEEYSPQLPEGEP